MSSVDYFEQTRAMILQLEDRERARGHDAESARNRVASRVGTLPGTIESYIRGRIKRVDAYIRDRAHALLVNEIQHEIAALTHELASLKATGNRVDPAALCEAAAALETAKQLMRGTE